MIAYDVVKLNHAHAQGNDQTPLYLNFSQIHRGPKNDQPVTRPLYKACCDIDIFQYLFTYINVLNSNICLCTVLSAKSDSDVIFCLQLLS